MKIIYLVHQFYPEFYTGTEKFVLNIAKMSQRNQMQVKVITYSFNPIEQFDESYGNFVFRRYVHEGIPVIAFRHLEIPPHIHYEIVNEEMNDFSEHILKEENPDLIHVGHPMRVGGFIAAAQRLDIPYTLTLTDFYFMCPKCILLRPNFDLCDSPKEGLACQAHCGEIPVEKERRAKALRLLTPAQGIYAPSQFVASMINKEYPGINVQVINHGMSYGKIKKNKRVYRSGDHLTFFYGGALTVHKGVHLIIEAFTKIKSDRISLNIYGSSHTPDYMNRLKSMAENDSRITFCGVYTENDVSRIYSETDVAIVPSIWYENYPLALHEALASNIPLIVTNLGGMSEKIIDGHNGYTFGIGNADELREAIEKLVEMPEKLNELKDNIKKFMIPTIEQEAFIYERIYKAIAKKKC
ncbi:glycosyl transferase group 1 [Paenibacillus curdlanolyticus YK9]|uniref:Glycosyl transferase group 1 n=1 Tax=Paenibacillus curdlanolyticus YK9 TaxID=717606 RepID=E0IEQ2_9BACL|nr:glycosyltransferase [Paenibacillus curdlanolyticus]EFM09140.1 glycosyl transferase group 1 [Paenibacillus curdlanolyticus YK9]